MMKSLISLLLFLLLFGCSPSTEIAGGGTDVSNPYIAGVAMTSTGEFASGAVAELIPADYSPLNNSRTILADTIGIDGAFSFRADTTEQYNLIIRHNSVGSFTDSLIADGSADSLVVTVVPYGTIAVNLPQSVQGGTLYIEGTDISVPADAESITIENIPAGTLPSLIAVKGTTEEIVAEQVQVVSESTITLPYAGSVLMLGFAPEDSLHTYLDLVSEAGLQPVLPGDEPVSSITQYEAVYISYRAVLSDSELSLLRNGEVPLICSNPAYLDSLRLLAGGSPNNGLVSWNSALVKSDTHPIAAGTFTAFEAVELYSTYYKNQPVLAWGVPWGQADHIMVGVQDQGKSMVFTFDKGDSVNGMDTPEKRIGLALTQTKGLTDQGKLLFTRTLLWAVGSL